MNFIVSSSELLAQLQAASSVIASKNTMPILDNFLFDLQGTRLTITATDIETTIIAALNVDSANGEGKVALDAKRLLNILKEFPEQPLTFNINDIDSDKKAVDIVINSGKYSIVGVNGDDFPMVQSLDDDACRVQLTSDALMQGVSKAIFATSADDLRPVMTGIFIEIAQGKVKFVASDGHKLVCYTRADVSSESENSFILPKKPATLLKNILSKADTQVQLAFDKKNAAIEFGDFKLVCRLIEGQFPNYQAVIPREAPRKLIIDRNALCNCVRRVSVFSNQASNLIKLSIKANQIGISAQDIDFSVSAYETVDCQYEGEDMEIGFKSVFLIEILKNLDSSDNVVINLSDATRAGTFVPFDPKNADEEVLMLLMPMMLN